MILQFIYSRKKEEQIDVLSPLFYIKNLNFLKAIFEKFERFSKQ